MLNSLDVLHDHANTLLSLLSCLANTDGDTHKDDIMRVVAIAESLAYKLTEDIETAKIASRTAV